MNIGVVGLGLIGASWAGDLRQLGYRVLGVSRQESTCQKALALGFVDAASSDLAILQDAALIFICTPIDKILPTLALLAPQLHPDTVISDAGSVKASIVAAATQVWPNFVGGHPMAGKAESGLAAAELGMFHNKPFVITPISETNSGAVEILKSVVQAIGCRVFWASPEDHDQAVAWISHLPVMVSASTIHACVKNCSPDLLKLAQGLASSGFRDTSRVGGGNPELGRMMAEYNRPALLAALHAYQQDLAETVAAIEAGQWEMLYEKLDRNQQTRLSFLD